MNNNIENSKNTQWENIEKKNSNWFREKWESMKNFLEWKKVAEKIQVKEVISMKTENLKDSAIGSTLDNLNLDMQEGLELKDSDDETKEKLEHFFEKWKEELKDNIDTPEEKELSEKLLQSNRFKNRSPEAVQQIAKSATNVENEIKEWKWIFYEIVRKIMNTEKK